MTSVTVPFFVGTPGADKQIPLLDAEFRFTTKAARLLERAAGSSLSWLIARGQSVECTVLLVCYGLLWKKTVPFQGRQVEITEPVAVDLIDEFIDAGGDVKTLSEALYKALSESGVYGRPQTTGGDAPLATTAPVELPAVH